MDWTLAIVALALLSVAAISRRLSGTPLTPAMVFVAFGLIVGPQLIDGIDLASTAGSVRTLAEVTLALVLFSDASRIDLGLLRRSVGLPLRLLGIGLPLTIMLGALLAALFFGQLDAGEAAIIGVILAPTDAALGQAVIGQRLIPARIRQGLNVESGLNDGICVPLLFVALAAADVESEISGGSHAVMLLIREIGYGALGGAVAGILAAIIIRQAGRSNLITPRWRQVVPLAAAALAYGIAAPLEGSGFIAAFVAGLVFRLLLGGETEPIGRLSGEVAEVLSGITFLLFGAVLLGPALSAVSWQLALYAILSLTLVRMIPVFVAMLGTRARPPTLGLIGWFGPRGLASIVFAVIVIQESQLPHQHLIVLAVYLTVGISVLTHGLSAAPLAGRYGRWYQSHQRDRPPER